MLEEQVVLVNEQDQVQGAMGKMEAHQKGLLHRAVSVLIFNSKGEMLIQQRAKKKYHWAMIWANACCSHPRMGETYCEAATRRTQEELGIAPELEFQFEFIYKVRDEVTGLFEHELDYVFKGIYDGEIPFNPAEVHAVRWISMGELRREIAENPDKYAFWFREILRRMPEIQEILIQTKN